MKNIMDLPEDCISQILSLTTPKDVVRSSAVSKQFLSASSSDTVWTKLLPFDIDDIVSRSLSPIPFSQFASKKDLFLHLSDFPILLDNSTKSFALDKFSGKRCYMIAPREMWITWGSSPEYWTWESLPESRFPECAVLKAVCWLEITGRILTALLSENTTYGVYFVFKINADSFNEFEHTPVKVAVSEVTEDGLPRDHDRHIVEVKRFYLKPPRAHQSGARRRERPRGELPVVRGDGWMEIEMGRYRVNGGDEGVVALQMSFQEIEILNWKRGLVVHGIDVRPLV